MVTRLANTVIELEAEQAGSLLLACDPLSLPPGLPATAASSFAAWRDSGPAIVAGVILYGAQVQVFYYREYGNCTTVLHRRDCYWLREARCACPSSVGRTDSGGWWSRSSALPAPPSSPSHPPRPQPAPIPAHYPLLTAKLFAQAFLLETA